MKTARLSWHEDFPETPISPWAGWRRVGWIRETTPGGQIRRPRSIPHPFATQRRHWALLEVNFADVDLYFATPQELDQFLAVMSRNPLPSGRALVPWHGRGRPNLHWLSRAPKAAKSWKFRRAICAWLPEQEAVRAFRAFYKERPVQTYFEGVFNSPLAAMRAPPSDSSSGGGL
ncbi:hypothetical protein [Neomegalonema perideroedes]|uniref:hypothetical protein n=1 Tax=Neomegalonema perideroedes TaxID=217219 RepID=UPI0003609340|nr:hypothetical protein [Neomegalonema perideroedes]